MENMGKENGLTRLAGSITNLSAYSTLQDSTGGNTFVPLRMSLEVYTDKISGVLSAINNHRRSLNDFGSNSDQSVVIEYHQKARNNQFDEWKRLYNVPDDQTVSQLQKHLSSYFTHAKQFFSLTAEGKNHEAKKAQRLADKSLAMCWSNLRNLQKRTGN
jgi:hypothetical protein